MANSNRRNGRSDSQVDGAPKWVVFVGGLATGVIATVVTGALLWPRTLAPAADGSDASQETATATNKANDGIHYEYDDMLSTSEVPVDAPASSETTKPLDAAPARVVLQAGSFRNRDDAENMRAQLLLLGIGPSSTREALVKGGEVWHRVLVGPFANETAMHAAQAKLQKQNIEALSIAAPADMRVEAPAQPGAARPPTQQTPTTQTPTTQTPTTQAMDAQTGLARTDAARPEAARAKADNATAASRPVSSATTSRSPSSASAPRPASAPQPVSRPAQPSTTQPAREPPVREQPAREQPPRPLPVEAASAGTAGNHTASNSGQGDATSAHTAICATRSNVAAMSAA